MSALINLRNEKGFALITVYLTSTLIFTLSSATYVRAFAQARAVDREVLSTEAYYAAEAGLQAVVSSIGVSDAYIGDIQSNIDLDNLNQTISDQIIETMNRPDNSIQITTAIDYAGQSDWAVIYSTAIVDSNGDGDTIDPDDRRIRLQGRAFLNSDFSKYMMYTTVPNLGLGSNLTLGDYPGGVVPANPLDRMMIYYKNGVSFNGTNIKIYGDLFSETLIYGNNQTAILRGDVYASGFATNPDGSVSSTGISNGGNLQIRDNIGCTSYPCAPGDGVPDDVDRNGDGSITLTDAPDIHDLTSANPIPPDAKKPDPLPVIDYTFYQNHNNIPAFAGVAPQTRFLKLESYEPTPGHKVTKVVEYTNGNFTTPTGKSYELPTNAVVYVNGDVYTKGEVAGRISLVSSGNLHFAGHVKYSGNQNLSSKEHSAAFLSKQQIRFLPNNLEVSGILYANNISNNSVGMEAKYTINPLTGLAMYDGGLSKANGHFRLYGNNITQNGAINTSVYGPDRAFLYDPNLKYYRPPGIPVTNPELRMVREIEA